MFKWRAGCFVRQEVARNAHSARNAHERFVRNAHRGVLTCDFFARFRFTCFAMIHHVECVAILEPAEKGR